MSIEQGPAEEESTPENRQQEIIRGLEEAVAAKDTKKIRDLMQELTDLTVPKEQGEQTEITDIAEIIERSQKVYEVLGIQTDLKENLLLPSAEQKEAIEKEGYTLAVIIDGRISRKDIIDKTTAHFKEKYKSTGVYWGEQGKKDVNKTEQTKKSKRPQQPYLIYLKPDQEVREAHPETMGKTFVDCQTILDQKNQENPELNLCGQTLEEYLIAQAQIDISQGEHLEKQSWTWLLEEQVKERGESVRCLVADWSGDRVRVDSSDSSDSPGGWGARFAAVPKIA